MGMVVAQEPAATGEGVLGENTGGTEPTQREENVSDVISRSQGVRVVVPQEGAAQTQRPLEKRPGSGGIAAGCRR